MALAIASNNISIINMMADPTEDPKTTTKTVDSTSTVVTGSESKISKRKYSRNGCTECKKRRMKCDESKPKCWQCSRLNRDCIYIPKTKNRKRKSTKSESDPLKSIDKAKQHSSIPLTANPSLDSTLSGLPPDQSSNPDFTFSFSDANLLYNDLNDLVNWRLEEALTPNLKTYIEESSVPFNTTLLAETSSNGQFPQSSPTAVNSNTIPTTADSNVIIFDNPLSNFNLGDPHNQYLKNFYYDFCKLLCPFQPNATCNPLRDILLHYAARETYLMYAILACGSKMTHRESLDIQDDQAYCSYLSTCLNILSENFEEIEKLSQVNTPNGSLDKEQQSQHSQQDDENEDFPNINIEPMLLTILLLTSDSASSKSSRWRAHLKGAKELLTKTKIQSDNLNFCRNWLISLEVLAGLSNPFGGIFQNELQDFITNDELYLTSLKRLRMLDIHGFNYLDGHIVNLDIALRDIINILNKVRVFKKSLKQNNETGNISHLSDNLGSNIVSLDQVEDILKQLASCSEMFVIDKTGIIPITNPNHPSHKRLNPDHSLVGFDGIDTIRYNDGSSLTISWFDITHQAHVIAAKITLMVKILETPKTSVLVQDLVRKGLKLIRFLTKFEDEQELYPQSRNKHHINGCMTHLHITMEMVGSCCIYNQDQFIVERFLKVLQSMGLASAGHNLEKLHKIWRNEFTSDEEEDILTW